MSVSYSAGNTLNIVLHRQPALHSTVSVLEKGSALMIIILLFGEKYSGLFVFRYLSWVRLSPACSNRDLEVIVKLDTQMVEEEEDSQLKQLPSGRLICQHLEPNFPMTL